jgi:hypothetical protein
VTKLANALHVNLRLRDPSGEVDQVRTLRLTREPLGEVFNVSSQRRVSQDVEAEPVLARILRRPGFARCRRRPRAAPRIGAVGP